MKFPEYEARGTFQARAKYCICREQIGATILGPNNLRKTKNINRDLNEVVTK